MAGGKPLQGGIRKVKPKPGLPWMPADQAKAALDAMNNLQRQVERAKKLITYLAATRR